MNSNTEVLELSGRAKIRALFHPRQRVGLIAVGKVIGLSYSRLFRRVKEGTINLRVKKDELGTFFVTVDDLAAYLFPDEADQSIPSQPSVKKGVGRPRKGTERGTR